MKKSTKKLVSVLLASAMAAGMLAGCGSGNGNGSTGDSKSSSAVSGTSGDNLNADTSEHVDLTMYLIGDRTPDFDEVYAKINETAAHPQGEDLPRIAQPAHRALQRLDIQRPPVGLQYADD